MGKEYNPDIPDRFTRRNHDRQTGKQTYRIPFDSKVGELRYCDQGGQVSMFGDLVDHLGRLEDESIQLRQENEKLRSDIRQMRSSGLT
ncbi:MAG: hypothetical protein Q4B85_05585 [Lachnospiraceae bacterium]|nr:hypothetical protein [Lachnospiraceae bacterium]